MKKRYLISSIAMLLSMMLLGLSCGALADGVKIGTLSYLNLTEEEDNYLESSLRLPMLKLLYLHGVLQGDQSEPADTAADYRQYDTLDAMLMALQSGEVEAIKVPYYTGRYLCFANDGLKQVAEYHPEKATGITQMALSRLSDGYSFMTKEENAALRDAFDEQIKAMKEDGTLQQLIDEHIIKASEGGEPIAVSFEQFEGDPVRIAVTGSLPPMDYVAADGTFAGFNTAVLAEIGKRLQRSIELVQVDSIGRALALSEGTVDVVFWTRSMPESMAKRHADGEPSEEELAAIRARESEMMTDEEKAITAGTVAPGPEERAKIDARDMPEGTIITETYFSDFQVLVTRK